MAATAELQSMRGSRELQRTQDTRDTPLLAPSELDAARNQEQPHSKTVFWRHVSLACRTATGCVLCTLPVLIPDWYLHADKNYTSQVGGTVIVYIVFTVYKNLGITVMQTWQGFIGTFLALMPTHILNALMPQGARGEHYIPLLAHGSNVLFIVASLWLNIAKNTRMFMLCYHCYFIMDFMNPHSSASYPDGWGWTWHCTSASTFLTGCAGLAISVLIMVLPYPIRATTACSEEASRSVTKLTRLVEDLVWYYEKDHPTVHVHRCGADAQALQEMLSLMQTDLIGSWWEGFDIGYRGRVRHFLANHLAMMKKLADIVFALQVCVRKEDFEPTHMKFVSQEVDCDGTQRSVGSQATKTAKSTGQLLVLVTQAAIDGEIDESEKRALSNAIAEVNGDILDLAKRFDKFRRLESPHQLVNPEFQSESFFVYCLSLYGRYAVNFAESVVTNEPNAQGFVCSIFDAFKDIFNWQLLTRDKDYRNFTLRNSLSILIAFYIGFWFQAYDAVAAGTISLLISNFTGSALQKNMGRIQGVVLGRIIPHIISKILKTLGQTCLWPWTVLQAVCLMAWEVLTNYVFYKSPTLGYIGCLAGAFGGAGLVYSCTSIEGHDKEDAIYEYIQNTTVAVMVILCVDLSLAPEKASQKAIEKLLHSIELSGVGILASFQPNSHRQTSYERIDQIQRSAALQRLMQTLKDSGVIEHTQWQQEHIQSVHSEATAMGAEAALEPRYQEDPWPDKLWQQLTHLGNVLRADLHQVQHAVYEEHEHADMFACIRSDCPAFKAVEQRLKHILGPTLELMALALMPNKTRSFMEAQMQQIQIDDAVGELKCMTQLVDEINAKESYPATTFTNRGLECDDVCRINAVLMMYVETAETLAAISQACIEATFISE